MYIDGQFCLLWTLLACEWLIQSYTKWINTLVVMQCIALIFMIFDSECIVCFIWWFPQYRDSIAKYILSSDNLCLILSAFRVITKDVEEVKLESREMLIVHNVDFSWLIVWTFAQSTATSWAIEL